MKPLKIYIAGRYSSDNIIDGLRNIGLGQQEAAFLFELGFAPFSPWWDRSFVLDNPNGDYSKQMFYDASLAWMEVSDAVYVISGKGDGGGVDAEIKRAGELMIPVFYEINDLLRWSEQVILTVEIG
ncbi:hypothetical protein [Desulfobacula sp.]|uniref:hypothetical protein n=1 Tax=Desulfobacula sp. TaxID=2593537 RepID=UPI001EB7B36A|nr:hypothetical protein [Desulfobacula sp.]